MNKANSDTSIYILGACRTPIGSRFKSLKDFSAADLGTLTIKEVLKRSLVVPGQVSEVILGNVVAAGAGQNIARQAAFGAGMTENSVAYTLNHVCAGGLTAMILAARSILSGDANIVIAGGTESASQTPDVVFPAGEAIEKQEAVDSLQYDGLFCPLTDKHMGEICEALAKEFAISRVAQDRFALESHSRALEAQRLSKGSRELVGVKLSDGKTFEMDERPRKNVSIEKLSELPASFVNGGAITAGNSSAPADGAAVLLLAGSSTVRAGSAKPLARILGYQSVVVAPEKTFVATSLAIRKLVSQLGISVGDVEVFEISEAFAAQVLIAQQELDLPLDKINLWGGDLALGHPLGAAGARNLVTLVHVLQVEKKRLGIAVICLGGGGAVAVAVENLV